MRQSLTKAGEAELPLRPLFTSNAPAFNEIWDWRFVLGFFFTASWFILVDLTLSWSNSPHPVAAHWTLALPILPATTARSLVFVPLCGMKFLRRNPRPQTLSSPRLPAPRSLLFSAFFILHSSFSHRGLDIDGPWQKILINFIAFIFNHLRQN